MALWRQGGKRGRHSDLAERGPPRYACPRHQQRRSKSWEGSFEPFGKDFTTPLAASLGIWQRFPGQWNEPTWQNATSGLNPYYNVHRWYERGTGRCTRPDPVSIYVRLGRPLYAYAAVRPTRFVDRLGLFEIDPDCWTCTPRGTLSTRGARDLGSLSSACFALTQGFTDVFVQSCTQKNCDTGRVTCSDPYGACDPKTPAYSVSGGGAVAYLCPGAIGPFPPDMLGEFLIHEFAHTCEWRHEDRGGVPCYGRGCVD